MYVQVSGSVGSREKSEEKQLRGKSGSNGLRKLSRNKIERKVSSRSQNELEQARFDV